MESDAGPMPEWLEPVVAAAFDSFVGGKAKARRIVSTSVPGAAGTGSQGMRVFAGFSKRVERPVGVELLIIQGPSITAENLRQIPMAELARAFLREKGYDRDPTKLPPLERTGRSPEAFSRLVAEHFLAWQEIDPHPAKRMSQEYELKQATIHSWIREARLRGFLPPADRGPRYLRPAGAGAEVAHTGDEGDTKTDTKGTA